MAISNQLPILMQVPKQGALQALALQAGQVLDAQVIGPAVNGGTQVQINGQMLNLVLPMPAAPGQTLKLTVAGSGSHLRLSLETAPTQTSTPPTVVSRPLPPQAPVLPLPQSVATDQPQPSPSQPIPVTVSTSSRATAVQAPLANMPNAGTTTLTATPVLPTPTPVLPDTLPPPVSSQPATPIMTSQVVQAPVVLAPANGISIPPAAQQKVPIPSTAAAPQPVSPSMPAPAASASTLSQQAPLASPALPLVVAAYPQSPKTRLDISASATPKVAGAQIEQNHLELRANSPAPPTAITAPTKSTQSIALPTAPTQPTTPQAALTQMVQAALPRQDSVLGLIAALTTIAGKVALPEPVARAAQQVLDGQIKLDTGQLNGPALQKAVSASGVFQEASLLRGQVGATLPDMKSALLSLRQNLTAWLGPQAPIAPVGAIVPPVRGQPPRARNTDTVPIDPASPLPEVGKHLLERTEGALARLRLHQNASLPDPQSKTTADWSLDLPVVIGQHQTLLHIQIHRDDQPATSDAVERGWQMRFALNVPQMGEVGAQVSLRGGATGVMLWASEGSTSQALEGHLLALRQTLSDVGLRPGAIIVRHGEPPTPSAPPSGHVLDERT